MSSSRSSRPSSPADTACWSACPGWPRRLMVSTLARILDINFKRIQFTPDLMPSDITGTNVLEEDDQGRRQFRFVEGPIFTNILLADEINRTPPKTQAALLQAMQEREVTVGPDDLSAARAVLHDRHAKPDRAGRDLSAARSAVGPLHVQHQGRLPDGCRGGADPVVDDPQRKAGGAQGALGPGDSEPAKAGRVGRRQRVHHQVRIAAGPRRRGPRATRRRTSCASWSTGGPGRAPASS